jgi:hypothetical protein
LCFFRAEEPNGNASRGSVASPGDFFLLTFLVPRMGLCREGQGWPGAAMSRKEKVRELSATSSRR